MMHLIYLIRWALIGLTLSLSQFEIAPSLEFLISLIGIFLIAEQLKIATEDLSTHLGEQAGGILLGLMGNLPEIVVSMLALSKGLTNVVKASLSGSIIGNLLFGLGCAILAASLKSEVVFFNKRAARINSSLVMLATCGLIIPAIFNLTTQKAVESISVEISALLLLLYLLSLIFSLVTHKGFYKSVKEDSMEALMDGGQIHPSETEVEERPKVSILSSVSRLAFFAILIAIVSEVLTDALTPMSAQFGFSDIFTGVILLSLGGNIGEYLNAISFAKKGKMDLAIQATMGSATQVALLVAPVLVLFSVMIGEKMDLNFTSYEVVSILMAVSVTRAFTYDGESHWLEGYMILSVYFILGLGFYHLSN
jgi:Ca2+:H+ antiporter